MTSSELVQNFTYCADIIPCARSYLLCSKQCVEVLNVGMCESFNESYVFTGFQGVSTMNIEEMPLP